MFTWPSRHDELLYWSCLRIALGIRRRRRRSQTEKPVCSLLSARRRVIADARSWGSSILVRFNHGWSWKRPPFWRALAHASGSKGLSPLPYLVTVRLVIARCQVDYTGRLTAHLPMAIRLILIKSDGSVSIHADDRAYKPLNWMSPPCSLVELGPPSAGQASALNGEPLSALWEVRGRDGDTLQIWLAQVFHDSSHDLGVDPGLQKDGVEAHLQALLAEHPEALAPGLSLVRREHPTPIGPVDLLCRDAAGAYVAVEIKRRGQIDGANPSIPAAKYWAVEVKRVAGLDAVEQLTRYVELLNRDTLLAPVGGILAAQTIKPQARTLADDRGLRCVALDYDALRGIDPTTPRLF
jgi:RecB family endonuclease NucS